MSAGREFGGNDRLFLYSVIALTIMLAAAVSLAAGHESPRDYVCGDANGDGSVSFDDAIYIYHYLMHDWAPPNPVDAADIDSIRGVTMNDMSFLLSLIFDYGPWPFCPPFPDSVLPITIDTLRIVSSPILPGLDTCTVEIQPDPNWLIHSISFPFSFSCADSDVELDTVEFDWPDQSGYCEAAIDNSTGKGLILVFHVDISGVGSCSNLTAILRFSVTPSPYQRCIVIDTTTYPPSNRVVFSQMDGGKTIAFIPTIKGLGHVCGDVDASCEVDIDDVVYYLSYIFLSGPPPVSPDAADPDCSGEIDIDDPIYIIFYIFHGGAPPCDPDGDGNPDC